jgi:hypothetical protein
MALGHGTTFYDCGSNSAYEHLSFSKGEQAVLSRKIVAFEILRNSRMSLRRLSAPCLPQEELEMISAFGMAVVTPLFFTLLLSARTKSGTYGCCFAGGEGFSVRIGCSITQYIKAWESCT